MAARRVNSRADSYTRDIYVDGNTVRRSAVPARPEREYEEQEKRRRKQRQTSKNRARVRRMSRGYVVFLTAVSVVTMFVCVHYIQLRSVLTAQLKDIAALETQLNELTVENDALYNQVIDSVDLEEIKDRAINDLGMSYAQEDQIIWYSNSSTNSYVRQYQDVPE